MNIGTVAERTGLPPKTIRYYEEAGMIAPDRGGNGYRAFSERDVMTLGFLARARDLGFSLRRCRDLLALWEDRGRSSGDVLRLARGHLAEIEAKIADLAEMRDTLSTLIAACAGDERPDCPILASLAREDPAPDRDGDRHG